MMFKKVGMVLALMASLGGTPVKNHKIYIRTMEIVDINYKKNLVTCVDSVGFEWQFYGREDYQEHDLISCLMDTMGTRKILDDRILFTQYTGYWIE